jgi:hypothetical protein
LAFTLPDGRSAYMEIKTPKGRMSDHQKYYRQKCWDMNVPYALVTCADDAMAILYEWGALLPVAYKREQRHDGTGLGSNQQGPARRSRLQG